MTSSNLLAKQMVERVTLVNEDVALIGCVKGVVRCLWSNAGSKDFGLIEPQWVGMGLEVIST